MKIKFRANIQGLDIKMRPVLIAADKVWKTLGKELVITAGLDGTHSAGSLHYYGRAVDLRTRYFSKSKRDLATKTLRKRIGKDFDVINHPSHIHVEYDPKT